MNNWKIIEQLFNENWIVKQCFYVTKNIEQAEFYQSEIILKLYSLTNLQDIYNKNEHKKYIYRLIFNEITDLRKKKIQRYSIPNTINYEEYYKLQDETSE